MPEAFVNSALSGTRKSLATCGTVRITLLNIPGRSMPVGFEISTSVTRVRELGSSELAQRYGIGSLAEAKANLAHPVLGARLEQCAATLLGTGQRDPDAALGEIDAIKLRSSMTLFEAAARADQLYAEVLERFYGGARDPRTLEMLSARNRDPS